MKMFYSGDRIEGKKTVAALGSFDGLHTAHMKIIENARRYAEENNLWAGVLLFDRLPEELTGRSFRQIMTYDEKTELLAELDFLYTQEFSEKFMRMDCEEFAVFLSEQLNVAAVSVGFNYRFGRNAAGDIEELKRCGRKYGFEVIEAEEYKIDGETVSSTRIRTLIEEGEPAKAAELLGRDFSLCGEVESGYHVGRTMGFPTVNLKYRDNMVIPCGGVYAGWVLAEGVMHRCVINVGMRPTFDGDRLTVESFLLDFRGNLYNKTIRVFFSEYLRAEKRFESAESLAKQIETDVTRARQLL